MRLSADKGSPYYDPFWSKCAAVFIEGIEVFDCVECDEEEGWVDHLASTDDGYPVLDENQKPKIERVYGRVMICRRSPADPERRFVEMEIKGLREDQIT